jgi:uncharacterized membrane protein YkgB|uniref:Uncharacterized protein n=1 Tax=viral metagenome TaxID=1070528 RepID=A0A6C0B9M1_9ZZZZ
MANTFIVAGIISIVYLLMKFGEMRFIEKESKPLKYLIRDSLLVYFSVIVGIFFVDQLKPIMEEGSSATINPSVFTDNPAF